MAAGPCASVRRRFIHTVFFNLKFHLKPEVSPGHDTYQPHPLHSQFIDRNTHLRAKVQVCDCVE